MTINNFKYVTILLLFITLLRAEWYYSPGLQIGFTSNKTLFISTQVSIGANMSDLLGAVESTLLMESIYPGITMGTRLYTNSKIKSLFLYTDIQIAMFGLAGYGFGTLYGKGKNRYKKNKIWIGVPFIPFSFDIVDFLTDEESPSEKRLSRCYGIFGIVPVPFDGWQTW